MNSSKLNLLVERLAKEEIRKTLLGEATLNINKDVDYIFNRAFKQFYKDLFAGKKPYQSEVESGSAPVTFDYMRSRELPSATSKKASAVNPVTIFCGIYKGSFYNPTDKAIYISVNKSALRAYYDDITADDIDPEQLDSYRSETETTSTVKSTTYHELSHWIRDSLNNSHIGKMVNRIQSSMDAGKSQDSVVRKIKNQGLPHTYMTNYEIDALIHNIKQFKRDTPKAKWNSLTLLEMIRMIPSINNVYIDISKKYMAFYGSSGDLNKPSWRKDWAKEYVKLLLKRMYKEGLLGDNMKRMKY